jgi:hypothetical protein
MHPILSVLGILLLLAVLADVLPTTMARGSGLLTRRLSRLLGKALIRRHRGVQSSHLRVIGSGFLITLTIMATWVLLFWAGWLLVYCGSETAVVNAQTKVPATVVERIYFSGYTLSTLGMGDFSPQGDFFVLATAIHSLSGLFIITFSVSYLIPLLQAAVNRSHLALQISGLGKTPQDIILRMCHPSGDCSALEQHLVSLTSEIALLAQRHLAYPLLHYFTGTSQEDALGPRLAALDEVLTILKYGTDRQWLPSGTYDPARNAITQLLRMLDQRDFHAAERPPPVPPIQRLREAGFRLRNDAEFTAAIEELDQRRQLLLGMVLGGGWAWEDVQYRDTEQITTSEEDPLGRRSPEK